MALFKVLVLALAAAHAHAATIPTAARDCPDDAWGKTKFESLVVFGDSYSDDSRLSYFIAHNGTAPPVGWVDPANYDSADGGRVWPQYVAQYSSIKPYNYAVSGASCSNKITYRYFPSINGPFPDVAGYEVPAFFADKAYTDPSTGKPFLNIPAEQTVYSMWIGTNDLGVGGFITDSQTKGTNITTYLDCVYTQLSRLYDSGARFFVLQNLVPLQLTPLYGLPDAGGVASDNYWPDKTSDGGNITEISGRMLEQVAETNALYDLRTVVETKLENRFPGAHVALYDMYKLFDDIYNDPGRYLNGTAPLSVTVPEQVCNAADVCVKGPSPDSHLWFDDLHPSEQTERWVAREFLNVLGGRSGYATYYQG